MHSAELLRADCVFVGTQAAEAGVREKVRVTPGMTLAHMTQLIMPQHANSLGITFGGQVPFHPSFLACFPLCLLLHPGLLPLSCCINAACYRHPLCSLSLCAESPEDRGCPLQDTIVLLVCASLSFSLTACQGFIVI